MGVLFSCWEYSQRIFNPDDMVIIKKKLFKIRDSNVHRFHESALKYSFPISLYTPVSQKQTLKRKNTEVIGEIKTFIHEQETI